MGFWVWTRVWVEDDEEAMLLAKATAAGEIALGLAKKGEAACECCLAPSGGRRDEEMLSAPSAAGEKASTSADAPAASLEAAEGGRHYSRRSCTFIVHSVICDVSPSSQK